jgi:hypothetical protein
MRSEIQPSAYGTEFRAMVRNVASCEDYYVICERLDLVPSSPEVDAREHLDAHARYGAVKPIIDAIAESSALAADVIHALCTGSTTDEGDLAMYTAIAHACVAGAIIRLVDMGKLRVEEER